MDHQPDFEVDIEAGPSNLTQESTSYIDKTPDDHIYPLMGKKNPAETISKSLDLSEKKSDKKSRKASKPPRPPKGPSLSLNDYKVMKEIADLSRRKRERIKRMKKFLTKIQAAKSSSSSSSSSLSRISIFSMIVAVLFFGFLLFQGFFAGYSNLRSEESLAPNAAPNNQLISVQFYNEFAPVDRSPTTSFSPGA